MTANHLGDFEFRICKITNEAHDPSMDCFENNKLKFANGETIAPLMSAEETSVPFSDRKVREYLVKLPDNLECEHCLFQVKKCWPFFQILMKVF